MTPSIVRNDRDRLYAVPRKLILAFPCPGLEFFFIKTSLGSHCDYRSPFENLPTKMFFFIIIERGRLDTLNVD